MAPEPPFLAGLRLADGAPTSGHPYDLAVVRDAEHIRLAPATFLVGDNGTGKSTLVEAIAVAAGFNAEGGGRNLRFETLATHSELYRDLRLRWRSRPRWGWFLRAETFYGMATHVTTDEFIAPLFGDLHGESHGESFLDIATTRFGGTGLYLLDEPEAALSFQGQLKLLRIMHESLLAGSQFVVATHSPVLMALPGATIVELGRDRIEHVSYDEVEAVVLWRQFLDAPDSFFRHLFAADG